jgi:hypothetical protein
MVTRDSLSLIFWQLASDKVGFSIVHLRCNPNENWMGSYLTPNSQQLPQSVSTDERQEI